MFLSRSKMRCPFCDAGRPELIALFGSQLLLSQYRCPACGSYFEGVREEEGEMDEWEMEMADDDRSAES
jgi:hypothetical protein